MLIIEGRTQTQTQESEENLLSFLLILSPMFCVLLFRTISCRAHTICIESLRPASSQKNTRKLREASLLDSLAQPLLSPLTAEPLPRIKFFSQERASLDLRALPHARPSASERLTFLDVSQLKERKVMRHLRPTTISLFLFLLFTLLATPTALVRADENDIDEYEENARVAP